MMANTCSYMVQGKTVRSPRNGYVTDDEAVRLITSYRANMCRKTLAIIVHNYDGMCRSIALKYTHRFELEDLLQEAYELLIGYVSKEPVADETPVFKNAYLHVARGLNYRMIRQWTPLKTPTGHAFLKAFRAISKMSFDRHITKAQAGEISQNLHIPIGAVIDAYVVWKGQFLSYDLISSEGGSEGRSFNHDFYEIERSPSPESIVSIDQQNALNREMASRLLKNLNERDLGMVSRRLLDDNPAKLAELARFHGITSERVRQLLKNAIGRMRAAV